MTREEIIEAAKEQIDAFIPGECADIIDFAMDMVRLHNEECATIAEKHWHPTLGQVANQIATAIRAAAPK